VTFTIVFFHAHPDDEALLTGGTMARLAAEGHRVVLAVATCGEAGLASQEFTAGGRLASARALELEESARLLGCARLEILGYADSGMDGTDAPVDGFCHLPPEVPAHRLAALLFEEQASVLVSYDPAGGYGHPDHVQVHRVGRIASSLASVPVLLEATVDRRALQRALKAVTWFRPRSSEFEPSRFDSRYADPSTITHAVDVRPYTDRKRAAIAAHASQASADREDRTIAWLLRLPGPVFRLAMGREWFTEVGRLPGRRRLHDPLASLHDPQASLHDPLASLHDPLASLHDRTPPRRRSRQP